MNIEPRRIARRFSLPGIQDLSKDQERARLLPKDGCHLVVGGPGTGKSVIALLRVRRHHQGPKPHDYGFLVYNRLLLAASRELAGADIAADTWISWFRSVFRTALARTCPVVDGKPYRLDWEAIDTAIAASEPPPVPQARYLIIDEGQDMPPRFYLALAELGCEHFFVVADQNQQITDQHSTIRDIENALALDTRDRIELTDNYRNSYEVARLARAFCIRDPASPVPELPPRGRSARTPVLVDYGPGCRLDFDDLIARILKAADRNPSQLLGVFTPDNPTRLRYYNALMQHPVDLDHGRPRLVTYAAGSPCDLHFTEGGIFVINGQSAKGLELDSVFLADIDRYRCRSGNVADRDDLMRRFYVMVSRARERAILLRRAGEYCPAETILPEDMDVLQRWR